MIEYRKLTKDDIDAFARMRIRQLREEGATEDEDLLPALLDYYGRHLSDGTFVASLAMDGERIVGTGAASVVEKPAVVIRDTTWKSEWRNASSVV